MEIKLLLFKLYVKLIRPYTEKFLNDREENKYEATDVWGSIKNLPLREFSNFINTYEYSSDRLGGLLDHSFNHPNYFFIEKGHSRDCDSWARLYKYWAIYNNIEAQEVIVSSISHIIKDAHVVAVLHMDGYYLCDYNVYGPFATFEDAIYNITDRWEKYHKDDFVYELYNGIYLDKEQL